MKGTYFESKSNVSNKKVSGKVFLISKEGAAAESATLLAETFIGASNAALSATGAAAKATPGGPGIAAPPKLPNAEVVV